MKVVVDTNILVSAILSPLGPPAQIVKLILSRKMTLLISGPIVREYAEVLDRKEFGFNPSIIRDFLQSLSLYSEKVSTEPLETHLPDPDDKIFLACALAGNADFLITGNLKHFPSHLCKPIRVISARDFLNLLNG